LLVRYSSFADSDHGVKKKNSRNIVVYSNAAKTLNENLLYHGFNNRGNKITLMELKFLTRFLEAETHFCFSLSSVCSIREGTVSSSSAHVLLLDASTLYETPRSRMFYAQPWKIIIPHRKGNIFQ
jgi:hypothetical protein